MESIVPPAARHRQDVRQLPAAAALTALGVGYGDIGTSALYGFKQAADAAGAVSAEAAMGIVSVVLWSLVLIVSFKYAILIMRADNRGEGGVITPAISVLSAVEGLKLDAPQLAPAVVPISIAILVGLFLVQRKGTTFIGNIFGPA